MTPRTDALRNSSYHPTPAGELWQLAYELERELNEAKAELARALRVVDAAREYASNDPRKVVEAVEEWEAGE